MPHNLQAPPSTSLPVTMPQPPSSNVCRRMEYHPRSIKDIAEYLEKQVPAHSGVHPSWTSRTCHARRGNAAKIPRWLESDQERRMLLLTSRLFTRALLTPLPVPSQFTMVKTMLDTVFLWSSTEGLARAQQTAEKNMFFHPSQSKSNQNEKGNQARQHLTKWSVTNETWRRGI